MWFFFHYRWMQNNCCDAIDFCASTSEIWSEVLQWNNIAMESAVTEMICKIRSSLYSRWSQEYLRSNMISNSVFNPEVSATLLFWRQMSIFPVLLWLPLSSLMELLQALESLRSLLPSPVKDDIICSTRRLVQQEGWVWISPVCHSEKQTNTQTNKWINKLKILHYQFHLWIVNSWKLLQMCCLVCVFIREKHKLTF